MTNKYRHIIEKFETDYADNNQKGNWQDRTRMPVGRKLDEAHLNKVEAQLGYALPKDYREFLSDYAGIYLEPSAAFPVDRGSYKVEGSIWGFDDSREGKTIADGYHQALRDCLVMSASIGEDVYPGIHLLRDTQKPIEELGWPEELLPIGFDEGGGIICLALFGLRPGAIFHFWGDIYLVANSFDDFMQSLTLATEE